MSGSTTFPPAPASLSGDIISINRFLNNPLWVMRSLRTLLEQMFISDKILTGQLYTESGSVGYEQNENIYADSAPQPVAPGGEYPIATSGTGPASMAKTVKWGQDETITDEAISRQRYDVLGRKFTKLVNSHVQQIDSVALSAVSSAVTQTTGAAASWYGTGTAPTILRDLMKAQSSLIKLKQGYLPDVVLLDTDTFAYVVSDEKLAVMLPREYPGVQNAPVTTGIDSPYMRKIGGFLFVRSPNIPITGNAILFDSKVFGSFVDERLPSEGYVTSDVPGANLMQVKTMRKEDTDSWRIRCRRTTVPIIQEPAAAWAITGVNA